MAVTLAQWGTAARTLVAQLRGRGAQGQNDTAEPFDGVEVAQPMGLRVNPVLRASLEGVVVEIGDERYVLCLVDKSRQTGAVEPETGGTTLYSLAEPSAVFYARASGDLEVTPKAGRDTILSGGSLDAARKTDAVTANAAMVTWMTQVTAAINTLAPLSVAPPAPAIFATITGGNPRVKA